jgi:hypothetical protein
MNDNAKSIIKEHIKVFTEQLAEARASKYTPEWMLEVRRGRLYGVNALALALGAIDIEEYNKNVDFTSTKLDKSSVPA